MAAGKLTVVVLLELLRRETRAFRFQLRNEILRHAVRQLSEPSRARPQAQVPCPFVFRLRFRCRDRPRLQKDHRGRSPRPLDVRWPGKEVFHTLQRVQQGLQISLIQQRLAEVSSPR